MGCANSHRSLRSDVAHGSGVRTAGEAVAGSDDTDAPSEAEIDKVDPESQVRVEHVVTASSSEARATLPEDTHEHSPDVFAEEFDSEPEVRVSGRADFLIQGVCKVPSAKDAADGRKRKHSVEQERWNSPGGLSGRVSDSDSIFSSRTTADTAGWNGTAGGYSKSQVLLLGAVIGGWRVLVQTGGVDSDSETEWHSNGQLASFMDDDQLQSDGFLEPLARSVSPGSASSASSLQRPGRKLRRESALKDEHLVCRALPKVSSIYFIDSEVMGKFQTPWPRSQEVLSGDMGGAVARPRGSDLILAVSHMWFHRKHPDPFGEKSAPCMGLVKQAAAAKRASDARATRVLVFFDFVSMTQRPFAECQAPRTAKQEKEFGLAIKAMPMIYFCADALVLLDQQPKSADDGNSEEQFGPRSRTAPAEKGWIYLERFIAMVKVAMTGDDPGCHPTSVAFSDSHSLLEEILEAGQTLRAAAKAGKKELQAALHIHFEELKRKTFSATSEDKKTNTGCGQEVVRKDQEVVESIMSDVIEQLHEHWEGMAHGAVFSLQDLLGWKFQNAFKRFQLTNLLSGFGGSEAASVGHKDSPKTQPRRGMSFVDVDIWQHRQVSDGQDPQQPCDHCACYALVSNPIRRAKDNGYDVSWAIQV